MQLPEPSPEPSDLDQIQIELARMRAQLSEFAERVGRAFDALAERDRRIVEALTSRVREHGELIARETSRISGAMQAYVQQGVAAIGQLSGQIEAQVQSISTGADLEGGVREAVDEQAGYLLEHLQLMHDRIGMEARDLLAQLEGLEGRTNERVMGLARLVRSDSEALRNRFWRITADQNLWFASALDSQEERTGKAVEEAISKAASAQEEKLTAAIGEGLERTGAVLGSMLGELRVEEAVEGALEGVAERLAEIVDGSVEEKARALARMIRSDNERLAAQLTAEQEAAKQTLRAIKELQANLPSEVAEGLEDAVETAMDGVRGSLDKLSARVDRMAAKVGERHDDDLKIVIDRMGDAMHALASLGRGDRPKAPPDRLELD